MVRWFVRLGVSVRQSYTGHARAHYGVGTPQTLPDRPLPQADAQRACAVWGRALARRRLEAVYCSGRCRVQASRDRRRADLVGRLEWAERALAEAAEALREGRWFVECGGKTAE